jgi:hypothetical protein
MGSTFKWRFQKIPEAQSDSPALCASLKIQFADLVPQFAANKQAEA